MDLLSLAEDVNAFDSTDVFKVSFNEFAGFFGRCCYIRDIVVILEVDWLCARGQLAW